MLKTKRVIIATICGFIFGFVCMSFANSDSSQPIDLSLKLTLIFSRGITGFMIGISALKLSWWLHGVVLGFIGSIPMMFPTMDNPTIMIATVVMGMFYAFLTELITSIIFKAKSAAFVSN